MNNSQVGKGCSLFSVFCFGTAILPAALLLALALAGYAHPADRRDYSAGRLAGGVPANAAISATDTAADDHPGISAETPAASPPAGTYNTAQSITLTTASKGADIYYTTDGSDPAGSGTRTRYAGPISIKALTTLRAIAVKTGWNNSPVLTALYTITHSITCTGFINGSITPSVTSAAAGTQITLTVTPDKYYHLKSGTLKYNGDTAIDETTFKFTMPAFAVTISAGFKPYELGERGPAGGWIFYDQGNTSGGWRFLECGPDYVAGADWGGYGRSVGRTGIAIGKGKDNTARIIAKFATLGLPPRAVQRCVSYRGGGYTDWFLPDKEELNMVYANLKLRGIGDFGTDTYWSSS